MQQHAKTICVDCEMLGARDKNIFVIFAKKALTVFQSFDGSYVIVIISEMILGQENKFVTVNIESNEMDYGNKYMNE